MKALPRLCIYPHTFPQRLRCFRRQTGCAVLILFTLSGILVAGCNVGNESNEPSESSAKLPGRTDAQVARELVTGKDDIAALRAALPNLNLTDDDKSSLLSDALEVGNYRILRFLLNLEWPCDSNRLNRMLFRAVGIQKIEVVKLLLEKGAGTTFVDGGGFTGIYYAACNADPKILQALLEAKSPVDPQLPRSSLDHHIPVSASEALNRKENALAQLIIEKYRDGNEVGVTPLIVAAINGRVENARLLLHYGADRNLKTKSGRTALYYAEKYKYPQIVRLLQEAPVPPMLTQSQAGKEL